MGEGRDGRVRRRREWLKGGREGRGVSDGKWNGLRSTSLIVGELKSSEFEKGTRVEGGGETEWRKILSGLKCFENVKLEIHDETQKKEI